ncbi:TonB-dependent receptor [Shewanella sp. GXUN23E]|uniref:TonB-dependent receptor n=1 Tax=Shewanella sp. GXUN23E TaxID=3422498 RepID=UPI003D7EBCF1
MTQPFIRIPSSFCLLLAGVCLLCPAESLGSDGGIEVITVIGHGDESSDKHYAGTVQRAAATEIARSLKSHAGQFLNSHVAGVTVNDVQNNPFQLDLQYRGFTLSPLLGLPQGMSVYVNGVRFNEPFGDTLNWDLIPLEAVQTLSLYSGSNPIFGQNTLGGALVLDIKDGFSFQDNVLDIRGGSHGMWQGTVESGGNSGELGYYAVISRYEEDGWRDFSPTEVTQLLTNLTWKAGESSRWDLLAATSRSDLIGNGAVPYDLMALEGRSAVYTHPDQTENDHWFASLAGDIQLASNLSLDLNLYYRDSETNTLNGDDSDFEECEVDGEETLCDEDDEPVEFVDRNGKELEVDLDKLGLEADALDGLNNTSRTAQKSGGISAQLVLDLERGSFPGQWVLGAGASWADIDFSSDTEFAELMNEEVGSPRSTSGVGLYDEGSIVRLDSNRTQYYGFIAGSLALRDNLQLTTAARYDFTNIEMIDLAPGEDGTTLDGDHDFNHLSPSAGLIWQFMEQASLSASWAQSSRAPTPVELSCADPDAPCKLPNGFVSDPPLRQVVTDTWELALAYNDTAFGAELVWFHAMNRDDIIFQQAGALASEGYFANVGNTLRQGLETVFSQSWGQWRLSLTYSYLDATFQSPFVSFSPNNPQGGHRLVAKGDRIPGLPRHSARLGLEWQLDDWLLGLDMRMQSSQFYRGDEANENDRLPGFGLVDLRAAYQLNDNIGLYAGIDNLFNRRFETFGVYGESDEVLGNLYPGFDDVRFVGPGAPRRIFVGFKLSF